MMHPRVNLVAAIDQKLAIGKDGDLPWRLPRDLQHFRCLTLGHVIVMGRKTYESIGKPLPKRRNIVLSSTLDGIEGIEIARTMDEVMTKSVGCQEIMVIGGREVYSTFLPLADKMYLTKVETTVKGKNVIRFPEFEEGDWLAVREFPHAADEQNKFNMTFVEYLRKVRPELI